MTAFEISTISARAYSIWEREGRPDGRALNHWLQAEAELIGTPRVEDALALEASDPEPVATVKTVAAETRGASKRLSARKRSR